MSLFAQKKEPLDDGEAMLPMPNKETGEEFIFDVALHLIKIEITDRERAEYVDELARRPMITRDTATKLHEWIKRNPC